MLAKMLDAYKIKYNVLNAKPENVNREAEIIAQAGRKYALTISTNMAGRGTDIVLGGNAKVMSKLIVTNFIKKIFFNIDFIQKNTDKQNNQIIKVLDKYKNNIKTNKCLQNIGEEKNKCLQNIAKEKVDLYTYDVIHNTEKLKSEKQVVKNLYLEILNIY